QDTTISTVFQHRRTQPRLSKATTDEPTNKKERKKNRTFGREILVSEGVWKTEGIGGYL
ncbi:hypothetical protein LINPERPRIM_LOCUS17627, partial [Linum perenne]